MESNRFRQVRNSDRRIASHRNLRLSQLRVIGGDDEITHHRKLRPAAQRVTVNCCNADAIRPANAKNDVVKLLEHGLDPAGRMIRDIDTR